METSNQAKKQADKLQIRLKNNVAKTSFWVLSAADGTPHNPANANLGQKIMQHISQLTPAERGQMLALIDQILTASHQQN